MTTPRVSVLMPAYNVGRFINEAIDSVLGQTYDDIELIIIDDCSTDDSLCKAESNRDPRLTIVRNQINCGIGESTNRALHLARGEYVALADADDRSHRERLAVQVDYMDRNPNVDWVSTWSDIVDGEGVGIGRVETPCSPDEVRAAIASGALPLVNAASMMRRQRIVDLGGYRCWPKVQDADLWMRCVENSYVLTNIPEVLYTFRRGTLSASTDPNLLVYHYLVDMARSYRESGAPDPFAGLSGERIRQIAQDVVRGKGKWGRKFHAQSHWGKAYHHFTEGRAYAFAMETAQTLRYAPWHPPLWRTCSDYVCRRLLHSPSDGTSSCQ